MTSAKEAQKVILEEIPYICYSMHFWKNKSKDILALLNFGKKVNRIISPYTAQLSLKVQKTNVSAQKINNFSLEIYKIVIAAF